MADANQFDIIGALITEKGLTGENLTLDILSHVLDIPTFMSFMKVSSTWSQFAMTHKSLKSFWIKGGLISESCFLLCMVVSSKTNVPYISKQILYFST